MSANGSREDGASESRASSAIFSAEAIEKNLPNTWIGRSCIVYDRTESTNDVLMRIAGDRRYDGLAVFANEQTKGKGRCGRSWQARSGQSVLCSVLAMFHCDDDGASMIGPINLASAIAAVRAVRTCFTIPAAIRWPNDIYVNGRKLGGILIESTAVDATTRGYVIGIGLNVCQQAEDFATDVADRASSAAMCAGRAMNDADRLTLAKQLLIELESTCRSVAERRVEELRQEWLGLIADRSGIVQVEHEGRQFSGRIIDIDASDHSLLIQDERRMIWHLKANVSRLMK